MEPPKSPSKVKFSIKGFLKQKLKSKVLAILIILFSSFALYIVLSEARKFHNWFNGSYYTVVVDCGSTGTRVNVYEWTWKVGGVNNKNLPVLLRSYPDNTTKSPLWKHSCQYHCIQTEPGLDKFIGNLSGLRESLEALLIWAERIVPRQRHEETPIFVLGTAGLRRLPKEDSKRVLQDVETVLERHLFKYDSRWIRVLSGKEEAYYGWVALNFKMGSFNNNVSSPTLGLLDLGGSSLQVVVETYDTNDLHLVRSKIGSIEHQILAYSLPAFGLNEAFDRSVYLLSQTQSRETVGGKFQVKHPCLRADYVQNYTCGCCSRHEANDQKNEIEDQRSGYEPLYLVGDPHWKQCKLLANAAATNSTSSNWTTQEVPDRCRKGISQSSRVKINLATVTHPTKHYHALSGFSVVSNNLNMSARAKLTEFWESGQHLCLESWAGSSSIDRNQKFGEQFCFQVPYVASLIESALCLADVEIVFGPSDLSWTLGAALVEGEFLWSNITIIKPQISISLTAMSNVVSSPIFFFSLLLCLLLMVYHSQIKLPMLGRRASASGSSLPYSAQGRRRIN